MPEDAARTAAAGTKLFAVATAEQDEVPGAGALGRHALALVRTAAHAFADAAGALASGGARSAVGEALRRRAGRPVPRRGFLAGRILPVRDLDLLRRRDLRGPGSRRRGYGGARLGRRRGFARRRLRRRTRLRRRPRRRRRATRVGRSRTRCGRTRRARRFVMVMVVVLLAIHRGRGLLHHRAGSKTDHDAHRHDCHTRETLTHYRILSAVRRRSLPVVDPAVEMYLVSWWFDGRGANLFEGRGVAFGPPGPRSRTCAPYHPSRLPTSH